MDLIPTGLPYLTLQEIQLLSRQNTENILGPVYLSPLHNRDSTNARDGCTYATRHLS